MQNTQLIHKYNKHKYTAEFTKNI